ncbi:hypothetical protein QBC43DRAFT_288245 [Cladorrhinum sp. PSN259]|nr:hypothetical protein QBC43DRAFT_288245 [Cladorrhinum sp. PSN259]
MACLRAMCFIAQDMRSYGMLMAQDVSDNGDIFEQVKIQNRQTIKAQTTCDEPTRLDVDVVSELIKESADGDLAWVQSTLENDPTRLLPRLYLHFAQPHLRRRT